MCRTDLHLIDGEVPLPVLPRILGHQVVGRIDATGTGVPQSCIGRRMGLPWVWSTCGHCPRCLGGEENLCPDIRCTGKDVDGGFAEAVTAPVSALLPLPETAEATQLAPLLCAGVIGYRALRMAGEAETIGLFGFGASAHLVAQIAQAEGRAVHAFTKPGDRARQQFARDLGCVWAGDVGTFPPCALDAALIFAPSGELVPLALQAIRPGGQVICAGIHMSDLPTFPYRLLWEERHLRSVAHMTHTDGLGLCALLDRIPLLPVVTVYPLEEGERALTALRAGEHCGALVLRP